MTRRDLAWRLAGVGFVACAGGTSLVHRHVLAAAANHPASAIEMGLGLASFCLASLGVLLIVKGARLRDEWQDGCVRERASQAEQPNEGEIAPGARRSTEPMPIDPFGFGFGSGRIALATWLAQRAQADPAVSAHAPGSRQQMRADRTDYTAEAVSIFETSPYERNATRKADLNKDVIRDRTRPALRHSDLSPARRR